MKTKSMSFSINSASLERMQATKKKGGKTALEKHPAPRLDSGTSQA
jgi:hypothetical protein